ncbi:unnamed protein product [Rotaria socialis]|uniref:Uncharacterized protein n=1 Tax=Rotaria socialis TaxID=392032 RepID=A0A818XD79_9BILA|nr:unnamed protein product [Rotaria socialis]CAF3401316.1 unnamed protein product [Rotaria socialis]CAF3738740.1 unnamed protein product [Rotaria socialis]CAF4458794.1 unnamed protein product [Rotaria socialis]CAF4476157.1 unnamed protein product [Rotaria socialis]
MSSIKATLFLVVIIFIFGIKPSNATVSCTTCSNSMRINITTDKDLDTTGCKLEEDELCSLVLRIDYTNSNSSFAIFSGSEEAALILTNGEPQLSEVTFIWFNELRVQRMANILCFAGASCGVDLLKKIYRDEFRLFDYKTIQNTLATKLYSSSTPVSSLTCADPSGSSVSCADGFCRSIFDGNSKVQYSNCVAKGLVSNPYGITIQKSTMADLGGEQISIIFTCNKPMCNSNDNINQVLQQLAADNIIPKPTITTTPSEGIKIFQHEKILLVSFLFLFSKF